MGESGKGGSRRDGMKPSKSFLEPQQPSFVPELNKPTRWTDQLQYISTFVLIALEKSKFSFYVKQPVDPVRDKVRDYYEVIRNPMDLTTIKRRLQYHYYWSGEECLEDLKLLFDNSYRYYSPDAEPYKYSKQLEQLFRERVKKLPKPEKEMQSVGGPSIPIRRLAPSDVSCSIKRFKNSETEGTLPRSLVSSSRATTSEEQGGGGSDVKDRLKQCSDLVNMLYTSEYSDSAYIFYKPVDPVALNLPRYFEIVPNPMDLGTIKKKLRRNKYATPAQFRDDFQLMFSNCCNYNVGYPEILEPLQKVKDYFDRTYKTIVETDEEEDWDSRFKDLAKIIDPVEFSQDTGGLVTELSKDEVINLAQDYENLSKEGKKEAIQMIKDYGENISSLDDAKTINFQSLAMPTLLALKALIPVLNQTVG